MKIAENFRSSENPRLFGVAKEDELSEKGFVALYAELTGSSETEARSVYMYSDIKLQQAPGLW